MPIQGSTLDQMKTSLMIQVISTDDLRNVMKWIRTMLATQTLHSVSLLSVYSEKEATIQSAEHKDAAYHDFLVWPHLQFPD